jgi:hypothetical protein
MASSPATECSCGLLVDLFATEREVYVSVVRSTSCATSENQPGKGSEAKGCEGDGSGLY